MADSLGTPDSLKKNVEWYIANQKELAAMYNGKILLIHNQQLVRAFDDVGFAYADVLQSYQPGTFTLQPCSPDPESFTFLLYRPMQSIAR